MGFWLLKTEPDEFSWQEQCARGADGEVWTGVRNHQAKQFLDAMQQGDPAFFYHTGKERAIVGIVRVEGPSFADPTESSWRAVKVVADAALARPVSLDDLKAARLSPDRAAHLAGLVLLRNPRLSVQPVTEGEWNAILELAHGTVPIEGAGAAPA